MGPMVKVDDSRNLGLADAKLCSYFSLSHLASQSTDFADIIFSQYGVRVPFSGRRTRSSPSAKSSEVHRISSVVSPGAKVKVVRIYAVQNIAGVKYPHSIWDGSEVLEPSLAAVSSLSNNDAVWSRQTPHYLDHITLGYGSQTRGRG